MVVFNKNKKQNEIEIIEIFASLNGEGYAAGYPSVFIRAMGCNLRCQFGTILVKNKPDSILNGACDTPECFDLKHFKAMYPERKGTDWYTAKEIFDKVEALEKNWKNKSICLTGGEPLLECNKDFIIKELIPLFLEKHYDIGIETNGAIDYTDYKQAFAKPKIFGDGHREGVTIIADYKLPSSKMTSKMIKSNFSIYDETDLIKMVISNDEKDWEELNNVVNSGTKAAIYISPMFGKVDTEKMWHYAEKHADKNIRVQLQLHKYFFKDPNEKGV